MNFITLFGLDLLYRIEYKFFTILDCCEFIGLRLLRLCFHKQLLVGGNCRFCLCSVLGERKFVIGCFYKIKPGINVRSIALYLKQYKFLLFLILNHPTDCPMCDQVGICEIQNMFDVFGTALRIRGYVTNFFYSINCGFFLQFVMSRCIHCLRCVRFANEILCISSWGFFGRGRHLQVGMFVRTFLNMNMVDSLIKICPVGALTSKIFIFEVRNWEVSKFYFLNIYDCIVDYILVNVCNSIIYKVTSISNDILFSHEWILNNTKNISYNIMYQRICAPFSNIWLGSYFKNLYILSWNSIYCILCNLLNFIKKQGWVRFISIFMNQNLDLYSFFYIKKTFLLFNVYNFNMYYFTDLTFFFKLQNWNVMITSEFWFLVGLEFETKFLHFGLKLKELWRKSNLLILCLGFFEFWTLPVYFFGTIFSGYLAILRGVSKYLNIILSVQNGVILLNSFIFNLYSTLYSIFFFFDLLCFFKKQFVWGIISLYSNFVGNCFINFTFKNNFKGILNTFSKAFIFFFDNYFIPFNTIYYLLKPNFFSCYIGSFLNKLTSICYIVLPFYTSFEKAKVIYMNIFGKLKSATRVIHALNYVASDFFLFFVLRNVFFFLLRDNIIGRWYFNFKYLGYCLFYSSLSRFLVSYNTLFYMLSCRLWFGTFNTVDFIDGLLFQDILFSSTIFDN